MLNGEYVPLVKLWDAASGQKADALIHTQSVSSIAFSPEGHTLAAASGKELIVWDLTSQKRLARWEGHADSIGAVAFFA
jgi:WD40 repeat protein